mmetsp:Transcript_21584/g.46191  ORF Transcript_21584/g.46191 Transcript_21584/m.46191 type:complete len:294 (+) Transcript_21584:1289-2170(+)
MGVLRTRRRNTRDSRIARVRCRGEQPRRAVRSLRWNPPSRLPSLLLSGRNSRPRRMRATRFRALSITISLPDSRGRMFHLLAEHDTRCQRGRPVTCRRPRWASRRRMYLLRTTHRSTSFQGSVFHRMCPQWLPDRSLHLTCRRPSSSRRNTSSGSRRTITSRASRSSRRSSSIRRNSSRSRSSPSSSRSSNRNNACIHLLTLTTARVCRSRSSMDQLLLRSLADLRDTAEDMSTPLPATPSGDSLFPFSASSVRLVSVTTTLRCGVSGRCLGAGAHYGARVAHTVLPSRQPEY